MFCSGTPEMYKPPQQAFSPHISRYRWRNQKGLKFCFGYDLLKLREPRICLSKTLAHGVEIQPQRIRQR
jgi:hypothetical protein